MLGAFVLDDGGGELEPVALGVDCNGRHIKLLFIVLRKFSGNCRPTFLPFFPLLAPAPSVAGVNVSVMPWIIEKRAFGYVLGTI